MDRILGIGLRVWWSESDPLRVPGQKLEFGGGNCYAGFGKIWRTEENIKENKSRFQTFSWEVNCETLFLDKLFICFKISVPVSDNVIQLLFRINKLNVEHKISVRIYKTYVSTILFNINIILTLGKWNPNIVGPFNLVTAYNQAIISDFSYHTAY